MSLRKNIRSKVYMNEVQEGFGLTPTNRIGRTELNEVKETIETNHGVTINRISNKDLIPIVDSTINVYTKPVAAFSSDTTGNPGDVITFTNSSTGGGLTYAWNFGDGNTSTAASPTHSYAEAGSYTVTLSITNVEGSSTETKSNYITISVPTTTVNSIEGYYSCDPTPHSDYWYDAENANFCGIDTYTVEYADGTEEPVKITPDGTAINATLYYAINLSGVTGDYWSLAVDASGNVTSATEISLHV